jgi:hypothetical protein
LRNVLWQRNFARRARSVATTKNAALAALYGSVCGGDEQKNEDEELDSCCASHSEAVSPESQPASD